MDYYHIWCNLQNSKEDEAFCNAVKDYLNEFIKLGNRIWSPGIRRIPHCYPHKRYDCPGRNLEKSCSKTRTHFVTPQGGVLKSDQFQISLIQRFS